MPIRVAARVRALPAYPFAVIDESVGRLREAGLEPIDFGVGDPTIATPALVRERLKSAVDERATAGYPSYIGSAEFRAAVARWMRRRFGLALDPKTQITSTIGSKEGIFNFPQGFLEPGEVVLCPSPGYPPYSRGTLFAGGTPHFLPLTRENRYLPDLDAVPDKVAERARILWLCYPGAPTGALAPDAFFEKAVSWCRERDILLVGDEAYIDLYYGDRAPRSILEFGTKGVVAFYSMSKRSAMTGWRIGWTAGDPEAIAVFRKVKTNIDSGTPTFVQDAAIAALDDEAHVAAMREHYRPKRDLLAGTFRDLGCDDCTPEAAIYLWQKLPAGLDAVTFAQRLLDPQIAVVCTPGPWLAETAADGTNAGAGYVRFALVPTLEEIGRACEAIRRHAKRLFA